MWIAPLPLALTLVVGAPTILRPSQASSEHSVATLRPPVAATPTAAVPDGWAPRVLVRTGDGAVVVRGPTRSVAALKSNLPPIIDAADAIARVAALGWPGAQTAVLVATARGRLAWRVDPPASLHGPSNPVWLVDAHTGVVRLRHDRAVDAQVRSFAINPVLDATAQDFELLDLDPEASDLRGQQVAVFNCVEPTEPAVCGFTTIEPSDAEGNFLYPAPNVEVPADNVQLEDAFAVQSVHHHAEAFVAWVQGMGLPGLPCHEQGELIVLVANYKSYLGDEPLLIANAAYTGDCGLTASFGQGPNADWGYDGEVVYHELAHGVVELMMGEGRRLGLPHERSDAVLRDAAAMNEGIADFLASVYTGDPVHAEYVSQIGGGTGRRLDNALTCPRSITGEVHADGELFGAALWDAHIELGDPLVDVLLDTVALLPEDATFEEAGATMVAVADQTLGASAAQALEAVLDARGVLECPRVVAWDELERPLWLRPRGQGGRFEPMQPPPAQLAVSLPDGATGFWLRFSTEILPTAGFSPITEIHAVFGFGQPIDFTYTTQDDGILLVEAEPALHLSGIDPEATVAGVWVEAPGQETVYVALFNQSPNTTLISDIDIEPVVSPGVEDTGSSGDVGSDDGSSSSSGDTGGAPQDSIDEGCGCRSGSGRGPLGGVPMGLAMLALIRRRRARAFD